MKRNSGLADSRGLSIRQCMSAHGRRAGVAVSLMTGLINTFGEEGPPKGACPLEQVPVRAQRPQRRGHFVHRAERIHKKRKYNDARQ